MQLFLYLHIYKQSPFSECVNFFNSLPGCRQVRAIQKYHSYSPKTIHFSTIRNFCSPFCIQIQTEPIFWGFGNLHPYAKKCQFFNSTPWCRVISIKWLLCSLLCIYYIYTKRATKILNCGKVDGLREKWKVLLNSPNLSAPWCRIEKFKLF